MKKRDEIQAVGVAPEFSLFEAHGPFSTACLQPHPIGSDAEKDHHPPERKLRPHPGLIVFKAEPRRQEAGAGP